MNLMIINMTHKNHELTHHSRDFFPNNPTQ